MSGLRGLRLGVLGILALAVSGTAVAGSEVGAVVQRDLVYTPPAGVSGDLAKLDLHRRDDGVVRPVVVLVHGGSWVGGDKGNFATAAPHFIPWWLDRGYAVASVNFRLASKRGQAPTVRPTDQARDIAHAIAWLVGQGETHGLAADGIVIVGYSSGAHLAALLGADGRYLEEAGLAETVVAATVSLDVHAYDVPYALQLMVGSTVAQNMPLIRHLFGTTTDAQLAASPVHYADGWVAPALLVGVDRDPAVVGTHGYIVAKAAERYVGVLKQHGHTAVSFHDVSETHGTLATGFGAEGDAVTGAVGAFLDALP